MSILRDIKLSRLQLIVIAIVVSLIIFFVMTFSANDKNKPSIMSENDYLQNKTEQAQVLASSVNARTEYEQSQDSMTPTHKDLESSTVSPQNSTSSVLDTRPNNSFSSLDDESLLNISDSLENSLVPAFLSIGEELNVEFEQKAARDVFVSRLPEGLGDSDFQQINSLLRDYLPYDMADSLAQKIEQTYRLNEQEQAYLSTALENNKSPETMDEQIAIAKHLASLKGEETQQETNSEPSQALSTWQKIQEKLENIQSNSNNPELDIHAVLSKEYGSEVADDHLELFNIENQWQEKYAVFLEEKNIISQSGLSEDDKAEQIESLIQQHYEENEWAAARSYDKLINLQLGSDG
tara:strand:+ start:5231 stop:6283 length:1053 start_codon:yes stop_codon:yes gene_type:complete